MKKTIWNKEDDDVLRQMYEKHTSIEISDYLNHRYTPKQIRSRFKRLGLNNKINKWSEDEINVVINYYEKVDSMDDIAILLPNRTIRSIMMKASDLGLKSKFYNETYYTKEQTDFIIDNWKILTDEEIASILGKTKNSIMGKRHHLGLYYINKEYSNYYNFDKLFRGHIQNWKNESMKQCDYQCVLTGSKDYAVHHLYGFNKIVEETFKIIDYKGMLKTDNISDYSTNEIEEMINIFNQVHDKYPLGVCLRKDIHNLFHQIYGAGGNTEEQFNDFKNKISTKEIIY